ncbi:hypothetical protein ACFYYH_12575 [Streptomyces sp. NPDC002018]|uniref:hypothetical protein n=1 Tax=Streptomyces sp. NPDC002018 TaxID=3364629 RepID=UPI0036800A81
MFRRHTDAQAALRQQGDDLKCRDRAKKWGMADSAKKWQASADAAMDEFARITQEEHDRRTARTPKRRTK